jgi:GDPmannose 4,6-dehydratase
MEKKTSLVTGITGQDGSYLADILLEKDYEVHGLYRRSSVGNLTRIAHCRDKIHLHQGDITDALSLEEIIDRTHPHEIYNVADQDHVGWSYSIPTVSLDTTLGGVLNLLEIVRRIYTRLRPKVFQPVSSMIFGDAPPSQNEETPLHPLSPYAVMKTAVYHLCEYYRTVYDLWITTGIMFNHDSPRRSGGYLLQELARKAIDVAEGRSDMICVGELDMLVDIGHAREYMEIVWILMQLLDPGTVVVGTGCAGKIESLSRKALGYLGIDTPIRVDPTFSRPGPKHNLVADVSYLQKVLGYKPLRDAWSVLRKIIDARQKDL